MSKTRGPWRLLLAVVALGLAVAGFFVFIPQTKLDRSSMGHLVVAHSAGRGLPAKASLSQVVDPSTSRFQPAKVAAQRDPDHTGLYAREWYVSPSSPPEAGIVLQVLPDEATARRTEADAARSLSTKPVLTGFTSAAAQPFPVSGVAGATGQAFALSRSGSNAVVGYAYKTLFRAGRAVESELSVSADTTKSLGPIEADVQASARLIEPSVLPASFSRRHLPTTASIVYVVVALVAVVAVVLAPERVVRLVARRREHRHARAEAQARSQYLARGRRAVRGRGAPPWAQPRKR